MNADDERAIKLLVRLDLAQRLGRGDDWNVLVGVENEQIFIASHDEIGTRRSSRTALTSAAISSSLIALMPAVEDNDEHS